MATTASMPAYMLPGVSVHQPPHLEGDASLATEILPGPPSVVSAQQSAQKRDPRKPSTVYSYLPPSDPGSTYSGLMHGTLIGHEPTEGPHTKRSRLDKAYTTGRAQRASARNQTNGTSNDFLCNTETAPVPVVPLTSGESTSYIAIPDDDLVISRSNSSSNLQETHPPQSQPSAMSSRPRRKDKGKAKEADVLVKVKEEQKSIALNTPEPPFNLKLNNDDHCSSCRSHGALVYCDGCPRAFHLWCLDPPMEEVDEGDSRWFCPSCLIRKHPPRKPPPSLLSPLIYQLEVSIPVEFQLPDDVRTFFKDVVTGPKGTYVDGSEIKQPRLNRHGQLEDRDLHRLRDRNGVPVLCFKCGLSALPDGIAATSTATKRARRNSKVTSSGSWRNIVSCDYCSLHWHLDCLDPPMPTIPPFNKKWMCPNHAELVLPPKRRIPKQNALPIEITKQRQFNNGNIDIIHPEGTTNVEKPRVVVDEVLINGRRYRVPEKYIVLDFWSKINRGENDPTRPDVVSGLSSPLTSLSSLDDYNDRGPSDYGSSLTEDEVALMLCKLKSVKLERPAPSTSPDIQHETDDRGLALQSITGEEVTRTKYRSIKPTDIRTPLNTNDVFNINKKSSDGGTSRSISGDTSGAATVPPASTAKRKRMAQMTQLEVSTRELRSRSKMNESSSSSISSKGSVQRIDESTKETSPSGTHTPIVAPSVTTPISLSFKSKPKSIKLEECDNSQIIENGSSGLVPNRSNKSTTRRTRLRRQLSQKEPEENRREGRDRRSRKRKDRDDELPSIGISGTEQLLDNDMKDKMVEEKKQKLDREKKRGLRTPTQVGNSSRLNVSSITSSPSISVSAAVPTTPSLKIRLPRLSNVSSHHNSVPKPAHNTDSPARP